MTEPTDAPDAPAHPDPARDAASPEPSASTPPPAAVPTRKLRSHLRKVDWLLGLSFVVIVVLGFMVFDLRGELDDVRSDARSGIDETRDEVDDVDEAALDATSVADRVEPYVFTVVVGKGGGTAFAMFRQDDATVLVTSDHVVRDTAGKLVKDVVLVRDDREFEGEVIASRRRDDVALIRLADDEGADVDRSDLLRSAWEKDADPDEGSPVLAYGSPLGLTDSKSQGIISALREDGVIQFDAPVNPGNSGGPLLDGDGDVIGVVTAELLGQEEDRATGLSFALDIAGACDLAEAELDGVDDCANS